MVNYYLTILVFGQSPQYIFFVTVQNEKAAILQLYYSRSGSVAFFKSQHDLFDKVYDVDERHDTMEVIIQDICF